MATVIPARRRGTLVPTSRWNGVVSDRYETVVNIAIDATDVPLEPSLRDRVGELRLTMTAHSGAMNDLAILLPRPLAAVEATTGTQVSGDTDALILTNTAATLSIDLTRSRSWSSRGATAVPPTTVAPPAAIAAELGAFLADSGKPGGFLEIHRPGSGGSLLRAAGARIGSRRTDELASLIGLGYGLTPSGDDFVTGALLAGEIARVYGWTAPVLPVAKVIANLGRTNPAGRTLLVQALSNRYPAYLSRLRRAIHLLAAGRTGPAAPLIAAVMAVGHTSGTDTVCGAAWLLERCTPVRWSQAG